MAVAKMRASLQRWREQGGHPLRTREGRTAVNYLFREKGIPVKGCSQCLTIKALSAFPAMRSASDGRRSYCRDCASAEHANRKANDPEYAERCRKAALAYYYANAPARRKYSSEHRLRTRQANVAKNANRVQNPDVLKRCLGQCGRTLPETSFRLDRGQNDGLRVKCRNCADTSKRARRACAKAYGNPVGQQCYLCMAVFTAPGNVQADHLIPVSAGGPDEASNLWWAHEFCNLRRGARTLTPEEWNRVRSLQRQAVNHTVSTMKELTS
ncbi:HNH endonuclease signature motif containing protein [Streptomyces sp. NPDC047515]|uniref:HNH endonuclease n=1 Tax=Streptomyces sp. NPDC047515 TaxID=3155380 RepID=UPI003401C85B